MAYSLQAIVIPAAVSALARDLGLATVQLSANGLCLIHLPYDLIEDRGIPFLPLTDSGDLAIGPSLETLCQALSASEKLAYVEAEFFGGVGAQACALYENGVLLADPTVDNEAINHALRWFGVPRDGDRDEFDVAGLGMYRNTAEWLKNK